MSAWTCRSFDGKAAVKIVPPRPRIPVWKGLGADSEEKREPVSDIDTAVVDSLKVLDPERPIREADICSANRHVRFGPPGDFATSGKKKPSHGKRDGFSRRTRDWLGTERGCPCHSRCVNGSVNSSSRLVNGWPHLKHQCNVSGDNSCHQQVQIAPPCVPRGHRRPHGLEKYVVRRGRH